MGMKQDGLSAGLKAQGEPEEMEYLWSFEVDMVRVLGVLRRLCKGKGVVWIQGLGPECKRMEGGYIKNNIWCGGFLVRIDSIRSRCGCKFRPRYAERV